VSSRRLGFFFFYPLLGFTWDLELGIWDFSPQASLGFLAAKASSARD
jgi:hypothetical protein